MTNRKLPTLGFVAPSGTGKTTLLRKLVPLLRERGLRVAYLKHTHHDVQLDTPGKDSFEIAEAGAEQVMLASSDGWTLMDRRATGEPDLPRLAARFDAAGLDLLLVEGFHYLHYPKIEVHRSSSGKAPLYPDDRDILAVVTDSRLTGEEHPPELPIDDPRAVADFIVRGLADGHFDGDDPLDELLRCFARPRAGGTRVRAASMRIEDRCWMVTSVIDGEPRREDLLVCSLAAAADVEPDADPRAEPEDGPASDARPDDAALELAIHREVYLQRPDARAVLKMVGPYSMAAAFAGRDFQPVDEEGERRLGSVPVLSIDAEDVDKAATRIGETLADYPRCLVAGQGAYICAAELEQALRWAELLELSATIYVIARQTSV
jgi:molybdopterin-guanine dinucleotide biosynthesis protein B